MQQHLFNHFCTSGHTRFSDDVFVTFIEKTDPSDLLKWEDYWSWILKKVFNIIFLTFIIFCLYWSLVAYISARTGLLLGLENLDTIITIIYSEMPSVRACVVHRPVNWVALQASWRISVWCNLLLVGVFKQIIMSIPKCFSVETFVV